MIPFWFVGAPLLYFALVFGAGVGVGIVREQAISPQLGQRYAELIEAAILAATIVLAAWLVSRIFRRASWQALFGAGVAAAAMVLFADLCVGLLLRDMTPAEVFFKRDSLAGAIYYVLIGLFAVAPALFAVARDESRNEDNVD